MEKDSLFPNIRFKCLPELILVFDSGKNQFFPDDKLPTSTLHLRLHLWHLADTVIPYPLSLMSYP